VRALVRLLSAHRDYRLLLVAGLVSMTGDWILGIGLTYLVYSITGSTLASGGMLLASFLPSILLGSLAGVMVDRWDRRTTMIVTQLLQIAGLAPLLFVHDSSTIWVVYAVAAYQGVVEQFFGPAEQALIPNLVPESELVGANGVNAQVRDVARLVGSAAGGVTAAVAGIAGLAVVDAVSFALAAGLLSLIRYRAAGPATAPDAGLPVVDAGFLARIIGEWRAGLATSVGSRGLRVILLFMAITALGEGIMGTLFAPFVRDVLHGSGSEYGLIVGIQAVGGIIGGVCVTSAGHRWSAYALFGWGSVAFGFIDLALFLYPLVLDGIVPALVFMVMVGVPGACAIAGLMTTFQTLTGDEFRGRVFGAMMAVRALASIVGIGIAGWLGEAVGIVPIIAIQGGGYVVGGIVVLLVLRGSRAAQVHVDDETAADAEPVSASDGQMLGVPGTAGEDVPDAHR
jgi:Na+/melibiose symporter-like transporter